jgi:hypothetical protein
VVATPKFVWSSRCDPDLERAVFAVAAQINDPVAVTNFYPFGKLAIKTALFRCGLRELPQFNGEYLHAAGDVQCETCGQLYRSHPLDWRLIGYGGQPFVHILCDGTRVKL